MQEEASQEVIWIPLTSVIYVKVDISYCLPTVSTAELLRAFTPQAAESVVY